MPPPAACRLSALDRRHVTTSIRTATSSTTQAPQDPTHPYTGPLGGDSGYKINPDGSLGFNDQPHTYLQVPLERYSLFGSGHIALSDKVEAFTQLNFTENYTVAQGFTSSVFNVWSPHGARTPSLSTIRPRRRSESAVLPPGADGAASGAGRGRERC